MKWVRSDLVEALAIDILLKKIRRIACKNIVNDCESCAWNTCISTTAIDQVIDQYSDELSAALQEYENNSFSLPQRWIVFQNVIDKYFPNDIGLVFFEVWCSWGSIGKILTNSNYAREYYKDHGIKQEPDGRETFYYGIDPNLTTNISDMMHNITWASEKANRYRSSIKAFENDKNFSTRNMILEKRFLDEDSLHEISNTLASHLTGLQSQEKAFVILSSVVRYHFRDPKDDDIFVSYIHNLLKNIYQKTGISSYYISREMYDQNGLLYPSKGSEAYQYRLIMHKWENNNVITSELPEFNRVF